MAKGRVPWSLRDVLAVHFLRLAGGYIVVRFIYPLLFTAPPPVVEVTDRLIVVALVWLAVRRHGANLSEWGLSARNLGRSVAGGLATGAALLAVSVFSERLYAAVFLISPSQHPLVARVEAAVSWRDLVLPLLLAGVAAPLAEELLYRLFTFSALRDRFGLWGGAVASAAIFAIFHFNAYWLAEMMVIGTGLALLYHYSGSLVSAIAAHSFLNTAKILLLYFKAPFI
jgi:membrane protease YdiL (CAAX protease family)